MRTNIVIDDKLMEDALKVTGIKTKKEAVEKGLTGPPANTSPLLD